jgi:hypothetical protein
MENTPLAKISTKIVKSSKEREDIFKIAGIKSKIIRSSQIRANVN